MKRTPLKRRTALGRVRKDAEISPSSDFPPSRRSELPRPGSGQPGRTEGERAGLIGRGPENPDFSSPSATGPGSRKRKGNEPSGKTRALVWERDRGRCCGCGRTITPGMWWSLQHRLARGQGGGNEASNLVTLCGSATSAGCHRIAENRDREYNARGLWLNSWEDPALVPVMVSDGGGGFTAWLTNDGKYLLEEPARPSC